MVSMKHGTQTRELLLQYGKEEFLEKGYNGASLRNICKKAGVTTGALYFFFKDKEDLFRSLVEEPLQQLFTIMMEHYKGELEEKDTLLDNASVMQEDLDTAKMIVRFMYQHHEVFYLLIAKSQGSKFENSIDEFIMITEQHFRILADSYSKEFHRPRINDHIIHWITHVLIDSFVYFFTHNLKQSEAEELSSVIVNYIYAGWLGMWKH